MPPTNPLLAATDLPLFSQLRPEHITPALDVLLATAQATVDKATQPTTPATWQAVVTTVELGTEPLARTWRTLTHLGGMIDTPAFREAYDQNLTRVTAFWVAFGQNLALHEKYQAMVASPQAAQLSATRRKVLDDALRHFRMAGAELPEASKARFATVRGRQAALHKAFLDNVQDARDAYACWVYREEELAGLPEDVREAAREAANQDSGAQTGLAWKFTLHEPFHTAVQRYAEHRPLREKMYGAWSTLASELGQQYAADKPEWNNTPVMLELLALRQEEAELLGYQNYAEVSLARKMAETPARVVAFLEDLGQRASSKAANDWAELSAFAEEVLGISPLKDWDVAFVAEQLRQQRYDFSQLELQQYFQEQAVLDGLFQIAQTLFGIEIKRADGETWHPDVRLFQVADKDGTLLAHFYLDPYARESKRGGAWMEDGRTRHLNAHGEVVRPIVYLSCDISPPAGDKPALLSHTDVIDLFHEFGHAMHHMLTTVNELAVSGVNGVEGDAIELPSQFMENFCWEWDVLSAISSHVKTGASLPRDLFDKLTAARHFRSGLQMRTQVALAMFDMLIHLGGPATLPTASSTDASSLSPVAALWVDVNRRYRFEPLMPISRYCNQFTHIFASPEYPAGFYGYKWAELLSSDAYGAFEEAAQAGQGNVLDPHTGARFRAEILAVGGSRRALDSFEAFRGRAPDIGALLRHCGVEGPLESPEVA
ncbi:oligopeptidase A [Paraburkholderia sp. GAS38]|jgi:oligopeptidase A|uniref:M3 family metallopeptidase n=1 Tax=Paraburkholderia sp. GAS38 TaxID=3035133 RepID=UPI003D1C0B4F